MRILVGIDSTKESRIAFDTALRNATSNDHILLCSIMDPPKEEDPFSILEQQTIELETINRLSSLGNECLSKKVAFSVLTVPGPHPGKVLCRIAEEQEIDQLYVGRRNLPNMKRVFIASTSKYCIENAPCNVTVGKRALPNEPEPTPTPIFHTAIPQQPEKKRSEFPMMATEHPPASSVRYNIVAPRARRPGRDECIQTDFFTSPMAPYATAIPAAIPTSNPYFFSPMSSSNIFGDQPSLPDTPHVALEEAEWKKYSQGFKDELRDSQNNLELTKLMEDKEREERVSEIDMGREQDKKERREMLDVVKKLEEEERKLRLKMDGWASSSSVRAPEKVKRARDWARRLEEQERASRVALTEDEQWGASQERAKDAREWARYAEEEERRNRTLLSEVEEWAISPQRALEARAWARDMEEQERSDRINDLTSEAKAAILYNSKEERMRRLRKVKADEEVERQRRVQKMELMLQTEREEQHDASAVDLQRARMLEEAERQDRIKAYNEDRKRKQIEEKVQSYRDLQLVKELEEAERSRRVSEMGAEKISRSSAELEVLKELLSKTQQQLRSGDDVDGAVVGDDVEVERKNVLGEKESLLLSMKKLEGVKELAERIQQAPAPMGGASV